MANAYRQGEHICSLYDTEYEQIATAAEYVSDGLRHGERCLYVANSRANFRLFRAALNDAGADAAEAVRRGALVEVTHADAHLAGGYFDSERMLTLLNNAVESALNDGFKGLRACGDMSWLLSEGHGHEQAMEYEALLNQLFRELRASGMCQYDRRRFAAAVLDAALTTHSTMVLEGRHQPSPLYKQGTTRRRI